MKLFNLCSGVFLFFEGFAAVLLDFIYGKDFTVFIFIFCLLFAGLCFRAGIEFFKEMSIC
jgi:hypothetical protein